MVRNSPEGVSLITFSRKLSEGDERLVPMLIVAPCIIVNQAGNPLANRDEPPTGDELISTDVARQQAELAMLHRALLHCGLIENVTGSIKG